MDEEQHALYQWMIKYNESWKKLYGLKKGAEELFKAGDPKSRFLYIKYQTNLSHLIVKYHDYKAICHSQWLYDLVDNELEHMHNALKSKKLTWDQCRPIYLFCLTFTESPSGSIEYGSDYAKNLTDFYDCWDKQAKALEKAVHIINMETDPIYATDHRANVNHRVSVYYQKNKNDPDFKAKRNEIVTRSRANKLIRKVIGV